MHISRLCLRNFRNFKASCINFQPGINSIIGENGSGKTNIMHAIRILLDECMPRTYRFFETDFNRSVSWKGQWIIIQIFFDDLDIGDESQALALHSIGNPEEFDKTKGSCAVFFRPKYEVRKKLFDYSEDFFKDALGLRAILDQITLDDYEVCYTSRTSLEFSDNDVYEKYVGNFVEIEFPNPIDQQKDVFGNKLYISNLTSEISCTFIKALRDVESDLKSYRDNPLVNLLRGKEKTIEVSKKKDLETRIVALNDEISGLKEVKEIADGVGHTIRASVGETYAPLLSIRSELPADMDKLMQSLKLWVGDSIDETYLGKIWELSLGGANLIYLSTKLLEYEKVKSTDKVANFLLIEEPEAHIHTHIQKTLFEKIPEGKTQVIISTHSTHISSVSKIHSVNIISKHKNRVEVLQPSKNLGNPEITHIERYLDAVRSNLLFARSVMLVEGDAEEILVPVMFKKVFGMSLDEVGISLVNIGSTGFKNIGRLFHSDRIRKSCAIVTDLDESILGLPENEDDDTKEQRDCRNSQKSGESRRDSLIEFTAKNDYIKSFFARNTFEVQFLIAGNSFEVKAVVDKQYLTQKAVATKIKAKLDDSKVAISGSEILRLANKFGKGWFALLLAEEINELTVIPDYILDAFAFITGHLNLSVKKSIIKRRVNLLKSNAELDDETDYDSHLDSIDRMAVLSEIPTFLVESIPLDPITRMFAF